VGNVQTSGSIELKDDIAPLKSCLISADARAFGRYADKIANNLLSYVAGDALSLIPP
jgi:hypothetical protein